MRILGFKRIVEYILNMNNQEEVYTKTILPFHLDAAENNDDDDDDDNDNDNDDSFNTFETVKLSSENLKVTLVENDNNNFCRYENFSCIGFISVMFLFGTIITLSVYYSNRESNN